MNDHPFIVLTGGPGGGKTTVIAELRQRGYPCVDEVGRAIIREEIELGGEALPWKNKERFKERMFEAQMKAYERQDKRKMAFFDRGILDTLAYARLEGLVVTDEMIRIAKETLFHSIVFITPPWEEIYSLDEERKQSFETAVATYEHMKAIYREFGYQTIDLPKAGIEERIEFILKILK
jgi:predicted ATPase